LATQQLSYPSSSLLVSGSPASAPYVAPTAQTHHSVSMTSQPVALTAKQQPLSVGKSLEMQPVTSFPVTPSSVMMSPAYAPHSEIPTEGVTISSTPSLNLASASTTALSSSTIDGIPAFVDLTKEQTQVAPIETPATNPFSAVSVSVGEGSNAFSSEGAFSFISSETPDEMAVSVPESEVFNSVSLPEQSTVEVAQKSVMAQSVRETVDVMSHPEIAIQPSFEPIPITESMIPTAAIAQPAAQPLVHSEIPEMSNSEVVEVSEDEDSLQMVEGEASQSRKKQVVLLS